MPIKRLQRWWLSTGIAFLILAAGCFQPAGAGLEATSLAQALPTFTPIPTETPTDTPEPEIVETATPTIDFLNSATPMPDGGTEVAMAQEIEPIWQTATAIYLEQLGGIQPEFPTAEQPLDPLLQTATALVMEATQTAEWAMTASAFPIFIPTETWTPPAFPTAGPTLLPGNDCVHQIQQEDRNLYRLGLAYGIHYLDIAYYPANSIVNPNLIYIGQKVVIPGCGTTGKIPPPTWTPTVGSTDPTYTGNYPTYTGNNPTFTGQPFNYTVRLGDTLFRLSLQYGVPIATIVARNPQIVNMNLIYVGDTIVIG